MCLCGSKKEYQLCCEPYLLGKSNPPTPEALMRSRYSAYAQKNFDYIEKTMKGDALQKFNRNEANAMAEGIHWKKLDVIRAWDQFVEFKAYFTSQGKDNVLHEISEFQKFDGKWYYVNGQSVYN